MPTGNAAKAWSEINGEIVKLVEQNAKQWRDADISVDMLMIGRTKATSSPSIIFNSRNVSARRILRSQVRASGILEKYPAIRLGDSSSPLALGGNVRLATPQPTLPRAADDSGPSEGPSSEMEMVQVQIPDRTRSQYSPSRSSSHTRSSKSHGNASSFSRTSITPSSPSTTPRPSPRQSVVEAPTPTLSTWDLLVVSQNHVKPEYINDDYDEKGGSSDESSSLESGASFETPRPLDPADPILRHVEAVIRELLKRFRESPRARPRNPDVEGPQRDQESPQQYGASRPWSVKRHQKASGARHSTSHCEDDGESLGDDQDCPPPGCQKTRRMSGTDQTIKHFACPFWKKDRASFARCATLRLNRIKDVKQHLIRCHEPFRCPRCQSPYRSNRALITHSQSILACEPLTFRPAEDDLREGWLSLDQIRQVRRRPPRSSRLSLEEQWFLVWDAIFAPRRRPDSPYMPTGLTEEMDEFRSFFLERGPAVIREVLEDNRITVVGLDRDNNATHVSDGQLEHVLSESLQIIGDDWQRTQDAVLNAAPSPQADAELAFESVLHSPVMDVRSDVGLGDTGLDQQSGNFSLAAALDGFEAIDNTFNLSGNSGRL